MMKLLRCVIPLCHYVNLDEQLARARENGNIESDNTDESDDEDSPVIPKGYVFDKEASLAILACKDRYELILLVLHLSVLPIRIMNSLLILI